MKTLSEILLEIRKINDTSKAIEIRLQQLRASGYQIEFNWVKNGSIGEVFYMKRKQVYRIQISASERCGNYDKAYCVVIPVSIVSHPSTELIKIRNISIARKTRFILNKSGVKNNNNSIRI
jgi:hypothetical protein